MHTDILRRAVRYYEGDIPASDRDDPFWGDPRAYISINALLFGGLRTERLRVREGKRLNPAFFADPERLYALFRALLAAADIGRRTAPAEGYRVERAEDFAAYMETGETCAFVSTCMSGFLPAYGDKRGIVLLQWEIPAGTPCIVFRELLTDYAKSAEDELLLPPFLRFSCSERALSPQERQITDMEGNPPQHVFVLNAEGMAPGSGQSARSPEPPACAAAVWEALNAGAEPDPADVAEYLSWKAAFQQALHTAGCALK